jgi:putative ABC transport system permease protein
MQQRIQALEALEGPEPVLDKMEGYLVSPEFFSAWELHPASGSLFTLSDIEQGKSVLVLGSELAKTLFEDGESLNRQVVMRMEIFDIVGTLEPTGTDFDSMAYAPVFMPDIQGAAGEMVRRFIGWNTNLYFTVADSSRLDEARSQLTSYFDQEYGPGLVNITIPREEVELAQDRTSRLVTIILFLALAGLLIAGANVSNILFSRALRKRRSVGILKALGASIAAVFKIFFWEALFISLGGAVLGAGLSIALSKLMQTTMDFAAISGFMLAVGVFISWLITKALTILPSVQASKIPAAEAIRYE